MADAQTPVSALEVLRLTDGVVVHHALCAAATLGIADHLAEGPRTSEDLAQHLGVDADALHRVLRLLSGQGVFEERPAKTFANTVKSAYLRRDVPDSIASALIFRGSDFFCAPVAGLLHSLRTGRPATEAVFGMSAFAYLRSQPGVARIFDEGMAAISRVWAPAVARGYDFGQWQSLTDVGGGHGLLLAEILRAHPSLSGVLADLPDVAARARNSEALAGDLARRVRVAACDFFAAVPPGTRAYLMKNILHDWNDDEARRILRHCRAVVPDDGALLIVEYAMGGVNMPSMGKTVDVVMLALMGGRERTLDDHRALLSSAEFVLHRAVPLAQDVVLIEARPVARGSSTAHCCGKA